MALKPAPVDVYVGARLRVLRQERGKSQTALATFVGVTFQQIQKYERGTNRISASRLQQIADCLNVSPAYFFDGIPSRATAKSLVIDSTAELLSTHDSLILMKAFSRVRNRKLRKRIVDFVLAIADEH